MVAVVFSHALVLSLLAASDAGAPVALPEVNVPAPANDLPATAPLRRDATASLTTIDAAERRTEVTDTAELTAAAPGTSSLDSGGLGQRKTLAFRGAAPNSVAVLLDGIPLAAPGSAVDFARVPLAAIDRVEVLRGGASGRYGLGPMGGLVNLVTRVPQGTHVFANAQFGSFTSALGHVGASSPLLRGDGLALVHGLTSQGDFVYRFDPTPTTHDDAPVAQTRQNNQASQGGVFLKYRRAFGTTQVDTFLEGFLEQRGLAGTVQNPTVDASQATQRGLVAARAVHPFSNGGELSLLASGRLEGTRLSGSPFGAAPYRQLEGTAAIEAVYSQLIRETHGLTALFHSAVDALHEPTGKNPAWFRLGLMLADDWLLFEGRLTLSGSARLDVAGPFVVVSPKLGASVQLPANLELKVNAGQSSRPPSFQELYVTQGTLLPNGALQPERALTADVGLVWRTEKHSAGVTGFTALYENLITYEYYPPTLARPYNFAAASASGLEVEASTHPWAWLEGTASYTWLHTLNLRDDARYYLKALPYRPAHRLNARVVAGPTFIKFRAELVFQSAQFQNRTETLQLPARAFVNAGVTVRPSAKSPLAISAEVKNLLDVQTQDIDGYPLPPRAAYVSFSFDLDVKPAHP